MCQKYATMYDSCAIRVISMHYKRTTMHNNCSMNVYKCDNTHSLFSTPHVTPATPTRKKHRCSKMVQTLRPTQNIKIRLQLLLACAKPDKFVEAWDACLQRGAHPGLQIPIRTW